MRKSFQVARAVVPLALALACGGDGLTWTGDEPSIVQPAIVTSDTVYTAYIRSVSLANGTVLERSLNIPIRLRYTNASYRPIKLPGCGENTDSPWLQKRQGADWVTVYSPTVLLIACRTSPTVAPGETYDRIFDFQGFLPSGAQAVSPEFEAEEIAGTYRLFWPVSTGLKSEVLELEQISNEFRVAE